MASARKRKRAVDKACGHFIALSKPAAKHTLWFLVQPAPGVSRKQLLSVSPWAIEADLSRATFSLTRWTVSDAPYALEVREGLPFLHLHTYCCAACRIEANAIPQTTSSRWSASGQRGRSR